MKALVGVSILTSTDKADHVVKRKHRTVVLNFMECGVKFSVSKKDAVLEYQIILV